MDKDPLRYDVWIEDALRSVVRRVLTFAATKGLPGEHHFYITFRTQDPGVAMPPYLKAMHPEEMTIVLQYQFEDLAIHDESFEVTLRFKGKAEHLVVPFAAVTAFADPSVNLGFQFKTNAERQAEKAAAAESAGGGAAPPEGGDKAALVDEAKTGQVIALDAFRKK